MDCLCKQINVGNSKVDLVILGQDSSQIKKVDGISINHYFKNELVSVTRSDGSCSVAQILKATSEYITVALGNRLEKQFPAASVPSSVFKLVGRHCLAGRIRIQGPDCGDGTLLSPLRTGQDCSLLAVIDGLPFMCYYPEELVAVSISNDQRVVGTVVSTTSDSMEVMYDDLVPKLFSATDLKHRIKKFVGSFYSPDLEGLPTVRIGVTKFRPKFLGDLSSYPRSKGYSCSDFVVGEPVAVYCGPSGTPSRIFAEVSKLDVTQDCLSLITEMEGVQTVRNQSGQEISEICKLDVGCYLVDRDAPVDIVVNPTTQQVALGRTTVSPLVLGQPSSPEDLVRPRHALYFDGLAVSVAMPDGTRAIARVHSMADGGLARVETADGGFADRNPLQDLARVRGIHYLAIRRPAPAQSLDESLNEVPAPGVPSEPPPPPPAPRPVRSQRAVARGRGGPWPEAAGCRAARMGAAACRVCGGVPRPARRSAICRARAAAARPPAFRAMRKRSGPKSLPP